MLIGSYSPKPKTLSEHLQFTDCSRKTGIHRMGLQLICKGCYAAYLRPYHSTVFLSPSSKLTCGFHPSSLVFEESNA